MTVTNVQQDAAARKLIVTATFDASPERVWQVWSDPRQLERWWGPPGFPGTVVDHDLTPGGRVNYYMTGPDGTRHHGWWLVHAVDAPRSLDFEDGFADDTGAPDPNAPAPTHTHVTLTATGERRTEMVITTTFSTVESMEQILAMGVIEGMTLALGQIDGILAEG